MRLIPGEDLASYAEMLTEYMVRCSNRMESAPIEGTGLSPMLQKTLADRADALVLLNRNDRQTLRAFIDGKLQFNRIKTIIFVPFPNITILIDWESQGSIHVDFQGKNARIISHFDLERLTILLLNQILRFILITKGSENCPAICRKMFTPYGQATYNIFK